VLFQGLAADNGLGHECSALDEREAACGDEAGGRCPHNPTRQHLGDFHVSDSRQVERGSIGSYLCGRRSRNAVELQGRVVFEAASDDDGRRLTVLLLVWRVGLEALTSQLWVCLIGQQGSPGEGPGAVLVPQAASARGLDPRLSPFRLATGGIF
jgi:hypothetical protein